MTRDEIIKLAREVESEVGLQWCVNFIELEAFAKLVAASEREACAAICEEEEELRDHTPFDAALRIRARGNT